MKTVDSEVCRLSRVTGTLSLRGKKRHVAVVFFFIVLLTAVESRIEFTVLYCEGEILEANLSKPGHTARGK